MARKKETTERQPARLCIGSTRAVAQHSSTAPWPACWKCRVHLGCPKCAAGTAQEVFCERCMVWGTCEALVHHGPVANTPQQIAKRNGRHAPGVAEYPQAWLLHYAMAEPLFYEELRALTPRTERGRSATLGYFDVFKRHAATLPYEDELLGLLSASERDEDEYTRETDKQADLQRELSR